MNSCIMLSTTLWSGIDLSAVFNSDDLVGPGIERDSHFTVLYAKNKSLPFTDLSEDMETILGKYEWEKLIESFKKQNPKKILDYFSLSTFEGEGREYLILRIQPETKLNDTLQILHDGLKTKYEVKDSFPEYKPHMTLATLLPGKAKEYIFNPVLSVYLEKSTFTLDDFVISYGEDDEDDRKKYQITTENAVTRYFRQLRIEKEKDYYDSL